MLFCCIDLLNLNKYVGVGVVQAVGCRRGRRGRAGSGAAPGEMMSVAGVSCLIKLPWRCEMLIEEYQELAAGEHSPA